MLKFFNKIRYITFAGLLIFVFSEIFLRFYLREERVIHVYPRIYTFDSIVGYRGVPHADGQIRRSSITKQFNLNNQGFYGPDFENDHPDSIYRILLCGSSVIEGIWCNQPASIAMRLDKMFRKEGYKVEVIDCGISGAGRELQNIYYSEELAGRFKANMVLYEGSMPIVSNNFHRDSYEDYSIIYTGSTEEKNRLSRSYAINKVKLIKQHKLLTDFLKDCFVFRAILPNDESKPILPGTFRAVLLPYYNNSSGSWVYSDEKKFDLKESIMMMDRFRDSLSSLNTKLVVFEYGDTWEISNHEVRLADISLDLPLGNQQYMHALDNHPNDSGYTLIANSLYKHLTDRFIPAAFHPAHSSSANLSVAGVK